MADLKELETMVGEVSDGSRFKAGCYAKDDGSFVPTVTMASNWRVQLSPANILELLKFQDELIAAAKKANAICKSPQGQAAAKAKREAFLAKKAKPKAKASASVDDLEAELASL